jgi:Anp1
VRLFAWMLSLLLLCEMGAVAEDKTVLLAILARNKAHVLPAYLTSIENLDYDKKAITVYINTNNNEDETLALLEDWARRNEGQYAQIIFDVHSVKGLVETKPHVWNAQRFKVLGRIRNKSMQMAQEHQCDYYFVVDCDNFITPCTLKALVAQDRPIIAPMLRAIPENGDPYSNFFCAIDDNGYYRDHPNYWKILNRQMLGTFKVPVVHCTYLIKTAYIDQLNYIDETNDFEFVIFSRMARKNGVSQYICNEYDFGQLIHFYTDVTLAEERQRVEELGSLVPESPEPANL